MIDYISDIGGSLECSRLRKGLPEEMSLRKRVDAKAEKRNTHGLLKELKIDKSG